MQTVTTIEGLRSVIAGYHSAGERIGFVPTMGALHAGHLSLVELSKQDCARTVVSIFVNPSQFGPNEDFSKYPRTLAEDSTQLERAGVDLLYAPEVATMYPEGTGTIVKAGSASQGYEGAIRPGHFDGVATVVAKLFHQVLPDVAYFGQKDAQQVAVIRGMVRDLDIPIDIKIGATIREPDGLAMSSRNRYLSSEARAEATGLKKTLDFAVQLATAAEAAPETVLEEATRYFSSVCPNAMLDYLDCVSSETFQKSTSFKQGYDNTLLFIIAAKLGGTRLLDNIAIPSREGKK